MTVRTTIIIQLFNIVTLTGAMLICPRPSWAAAKLDDSTLMLTLSQPYFKDREVYQDLFISFPGLAVQQTANLESVTIQCYAMMGSADSLLVYRLRFGDLSSKRSDVFYSDLKLLPKNKNDLFLASYRQTLRKNHRLPVGRYKTILTLQEMGKPKVTRTIVHQVDSNLYMASPVFRMLDTYGGAEPKVHRWTSGRLPSSLNRKLQAKGYSIQYRVSGKLRYADIYCGDHFLGYYALASSKASTEKTSRWSTTSKNSIALPGDITAVLKDNQTVFTQVRNRSRTMEDKEVVGRIYMNLGAANDLEINSGQQNNHFDFGGHIEVPLLNIPIVLDGYYTSQDLHRTARASYINVHYDARKAKRELLGLIRHYQQTHSEVTSRAQGVQSLYATALERLQMDRSESIQQLVAAGKFLEPADAKRFQKDTTGLFESMVASQVGDVRDSLLPRSSGLLQTAKDNEAAIQARYTSVVGAYQRLEALDQKIAHFKSLAEQYRTNRYFDSIMGQAKLQALNQGSLEEKTYKELTKDAASLLPHGHSRKFASGVTEFDAGIFTPWVSQYTLGGQTMRGVNFAYDLGPAEAGFTYGRIEYIGRDGSLDPYQGYCARLRFKPATGQQTQLIYYGYRPDRVLLTDGDFFQDIEAHMPSFLTPVHILSLAHQGEASKYVRVDLEAASSFRGGQWMGHPEESFSSRSSWRMDLESSIPGTLIDIAGGYEHVGSNFANHTLPMNLVGIDRYRLEGKGHFFKRFLRLGIEYNYITRQNLLVHRSGQSKWGFELGTSWRRYPNLSLAYKPFSTFRSYVDTSAIAGRMIYGSVWQGKLSYQVKRPHGNFRFSALYHENRSIMDSNFTGSTMIQGNILYTAGKMTSMLNLGKSKMDAEVLSAHHEQTWFSNFSGGYQLSDQWMVQGGGDLGLHAAGFSRYGFQFGGRYQFAKVPLTVHGGIRYHRFRPSALPLWRTVYGASLAVDWSFRFKVKES